MGIGLVRSLKLHLSYSHVVFVRIGHASVEDVVFSGPWALSYLRESMYYSRAACVDLRR